MLDCRKMPLSPVVSAHISQVVLLALVALALHVSAIELFAGEPRTSTTSPAPVDRFGGANAAPLPKVFVAPFRGATGATTAKLVRSDLERSGAFEVVSFESSDAYGIHAEATGGWVDAMVFRPDGRILFQRRYESPNLRQNVHRFSDDYVEIVTQRPGIASSVIAFVSDVTGSRQLYLCDSDGEDIRQITNEPEVEAVHPCFSLKNGKTLFTSVRNGFADIWAIDLVTEERKRLINAPGDNRYPVLSPGGERLAVTMSYTGTTDLYVTTALGGRGRRITDDDAIESYPTWSPDGRHLVFEQRFENQGSRLCLVSSLGGKSNPLPTKSSADAAEYSHPDWSPDGRSIAFTNKTEGHTTIAVFDVNTRTTTVVGGTESGRSPSWAPDSRHMVYLKGNALWIADTTGGRCTEILSGFGNVSEPTWSR